MSIPSGPPCAWNATTIEWLNARLGVQHDDDVGCEDWPGAMADPTLVDTALDAYDNPDAGQAGRALVVEWLLETFEFCTIEREGNPDWRRTLDRSLTNSTKLALARSERLGAAEAYQECSVAAVDHLLVEAGGPVWAEPAFDALVARVQRDFVAMAARAATVVGEIAGTVTAVDERLATMVAAALDDTVVDVQAHLARLLHAGWISAAGVDRLPDVLRYVRAVEHRLEKAVGAPERDRSRIRSVRALEQEYAEVARRDLDGSVRWMLEELRVATFAQSLGAKPGTSEQKIRKALSALT